MKVATGVASSISGTVHRNEDLPQQCIEELKPSPVPEQNRTATPASPSQESSPRHEPAGHGKESIKYIRQNQNPERILEEKPAKPSQASPRGRLPARTQDSKPETARSESPGARIQFADRNRAGPASSSVPRQLIKETKTSRLRMSLAEEKRRNARKPPDPPLRPARSTSAGSRRGASFNMSTSGSREERQRTPRATPWQSPSQMSRTSFLEKNPEDVQVETLLGETSATSTNEPMVYPGTNAKSNPPYPAYVEPSDEPQKRDPSPDLAAVCRRHHLARLLQSELDHPDRQNTEVIDHIFHAIASDGHLRGDGTSEIFEQVRHFISKNHCKAQSLEDRVRRLENVNTQLAAENQMLRCSPSFCGSQPGTPGWAPRTISLPVSPVPTPSHRVTRLSSQTMITGSSAACTSQPVCQRQRSESPRPSSGWSGVMRGVVVPHVSGNCSPPTSPRISPMMPCHGAPVRALTPPNHAPSAKWRINGPPLVHEESSTQNARMLSPSKIVLTNLACMQPVYSPPPRVSCIHPTEYAWKCPWACPP